MGIYFEGDIKTKLFFGMTEETPMTLGADYNTKIQYHFDENNSADIKQCMDKQKQNLLQYGIRFNTMEELDALINTSTSDLCRKYSVKAEDLSFIREQFATYYLGQQILEVLQNKKNCHFWMYL